ncbi:UNVERIFIED_CONTAM: sensor domain-containing diguanylate cyclase [Halobacillus marinus]|uniref:sensor domain-containing diguanylate cyclase n=1 Tax=Bacillaceae TaxID=186817 RepID=UPI0003F617E9|nr:MULTISPECIES: sensor domain-containing diguanylate cyclase [Bacillaceae]QHT47433.1 sensor domain-containing diguanylate cyclase [Bacillus sp. SB49]
MIIDSQLDDQLIPLQSRLFQMAVAGKAKTFERFVQAMAGEMKRFLRADYGAIYYWDDWKGRYRLHVEPNAEPLAIRTDFSKEEVEDEDGQMKSREFLAEWVVSEPEFSFSIIPLQTEDHLHGFIVIGVRGAGMPERKREERLSGEVLKCLKQVEDYYEVYEERCKYELLYKVTSHFHSSIDTDGVLSEIVATLRKVYPEFSYNLLLSQDYTTKSDLPVQELRYDKEAGSEASTQAYLTGELQIEDRLQEGRSFLYAPLKGKQGVYGVLQVAAPDYLYFPKKDIEFFLLIANTAGNALENAKLYQQSRKLNNDLKLINATSKKLNSNIRLNEKISYISEEIESSFQADEVGFATFLEGGGYQVLEGSSSYFTMNDPQDFLEEVERVMVEESGPLFISDVTTMNTPISSDFRSVMAVPMTDHDHISGLAVVMHREPCIFSFESFKLLKSLVHHSTLAFANSILREELEQTVVTDYLTKLSSRIHLDQKVAAHIEKDDSGHFLLFDIDDFKAVNDTYGHQIGDEVICQVARIIKRCTADVGVAARWGGEELALYVPDLTAQEAYDYAETIRVEVEEHTRPSVTVSCGIASWKKSGQAPGQKQLVQVADAALYKGKEMGKNVIIHQHIQP